ncbi:MAG: 4Fe-4S dicluster domain-containing protein [Candidatus Latescibacterota bacterium]
MSAVEAIRGEAARLLSGGQVKLVIAHGARGGRRVPLFAADAAQAAQIVLDDDCRHNLATYLRKPEIRARFPVAVVARPAVMRSLVVLRCESQLAPGDVLVLAAGPEEYHGVVDLPGAAALLREHYAKVALDPELVVRLGQLKALSAEGRAAFWREELSRCTRCHACRAACPGCYCTRCVAERNQPQWIAPSPVAHGSYAWAVVRAYHQAGRCTLCGACQAACPQGLPLMLLNATLVQCVEEEFGYRSGYDVEAAPFIGSWEAKDPEGFVR